MLNKGIGHKNTVQNVNIYPCKCLRFTKTYLLKYLQTHIKYPSNFVCKKVSKSKTTRVYGRNLRYQFNYFDRLIDKSVFSIQSISVDKLVDAIEKAH
jgi:hypothetical protein